MKKTTGIRVAFSGLVALVALLALGAATVAAGASSARGERQFAAGADTSALQLSPALKRVLRSGRATAARRAVARSATRGATADLGPGEHPGFAYCGNDYAYTWPAYAPEHDFTLTRTYFVSSVIGNFSDAVVEPGPYYVIQVGEDYYLYDIELGQVVDGPTEYADAWVPYYSPANTDYFVYYNEIITFDGGSPNPPEYHLLTAIGPSVNPPPNRCQP